MSSRLTFFVVVLLGLDACFFTGKSYLSLSNFCLVEKTVRVVSPLTGDWKISTETDCSCSV